LELFYGPDPIIPTEGWLQDAHCISFSSTKATDSRRCLAADIARSPDAALAPGSLERRVSDIGACPPLPRLPRLQLPRPLCPVPRHHATTSGCCASPATCVPPPQDATPLLSSSLSSHPTTRLVAVRSCWYLGKCVSLLIDDDDFAILNYLLL
jgi:hypothetical protein